MESADRRLVVTPLSGDPLSVRLEVAAMGDEVLQLPYYFAQADGWRLRDGGGKEVPYKGRKVRRKSPQSMEGDAGWVRIAPGGAPYVVDRVQLHDCFDLSGKTGPFSYIVCGCVCTVVDEGAAPAAVPRTDDKVDGSSGAVTSVTGTVHAPVVGKVSSAHHRLCMEMAIREAKKSKPSPNAYCVGCILVPRGTADTLDEMFSVVTAESQASAAAAVLAAGYSREIPGNTHAEQCALMKMQAAGNGAAGCDMYTTMEPCSKRLSGNMPCVENCIKHGVGRVFVGVREPTHFVRCEGVAQLVEAGIPCFDVVWDGVEDECLAMNRHIAKFEVL